VSARFGSGVVDKSTVYAFRYASLMIVGMGHDSETILIMGDFNFPEISYKDNSVAAGPAAAASRFYNMTQDKFIMQCVFEPTRVREGNTHRPALGLHFDE